MRQSLIQKDWVRGLAAPLRAHRRGVPLGCRGDPARADAQQPGAPQCRYVLVDVAIVAPKRLGERLDAAGRMPKHMLQYRDSVRGQRLEELAPGLNGTCSSGCTGSPRFKRCTVSTTRRSDSDSSSAMWMNSRVMTGLSPSPPRPSPPTSTRPRKSRTDISPPPRARTPRASARCRRTRTPA